MAGSREIQRIQSAPGGRGHVYLTLADEDAVIECAIWARWATKLKELPETGDLVQAHYQQVEYYGKKGTTFHVDRLRPTGEGELLRRKAQILKRLQTDGLTDPARKRSSRTFPRRVGLDRGP